MHPGQQALFQRLVELREAAGMSYSDAEAALVLGPGWIKRLEAGEIEPTLDTLGAVVTAYGSDLAALFSGVKFGAGAVTMDRHLSAVQYKKDLLVSFPMGAHNSEITLPDATLSDLNDILRILRDKLAADQKSVAIRDCFLEAVARWPHLNPSDLWYFVVSHAYQDPYNHPASTMGLNLEQSYRRASGWSLEAVLVDHYNPHLKTLGIRMEMPKGDRRKRLLSEMGVNDVQGSDKADVIVVGRRKQKDEAFGVVHVKASFAERRTDDVPLSLLLQSRGFASPLVTMDCKASPGPHPFNRGELGPVQGSDADVSAKRLDIEVDRKFDACFSYNANTLPTPSGGASARIHIVNFSDPNDAFSAHLDRKWKDRQGL